MLWAKVLVVPLTRTISYSIACAEYPAMWKALLEETKPKLGNQRDQGKVYVVM